jgi:hypothetical protein
MVVTREVEAKNFVLNIGHLGRREPVVQPASSEERGLRVKRIFSLLAVTALMVAMLVATAMPAFAAKGGKSETAPNCLRGQITAAFDQETFEGFLKHIDKVVNQCGGPQP